MKRKSLLTALFLLVAGLQITWAQKVVLYKTNNQTIECEVSELDSIVFVEAEAKLVTNIVLSRTSLTLQPGESEVLTATVLPENAENKSVTWESSSLAVAVVASDGTVVAVANGTCTVTCHAIDGSGVTAECQVRVKEPDTVEYVDLGLPSGTLWATCNVGANSPEEYGDYFAWGETEPKSEYSWSTYKYCNGSTITPHMTKYCNKSSDGYNGFTDTLTELLPEDDAATANWGSGWQMPSTAQQQELINSEYTTTTWTTLNGVNGRMIVSKSNGNHIFLPAAGFYEYTSLYTYIGTYGFYWSRSLNTRNSLHGRYLAVYSSYIDTANYYRNVGQSVRPVRKQ